MLRCIIGAGLRQEIDMFIVAVDVGYSNLKVLWGEAGQPPATRTLPAGAGPATAMPERLTRGRAEQHQTVMVAEQRWVAGVEPSRLQNWERELHPDYPATLAYRALLHAALAVAGRAEVDRLVTGLPVAQYQDRARRERLRDMMTGTHQITPARPVTVHAVDVLPQPFGAYLDMVETATDPDAFETARTLVIDPGFFSCDWVLIDDGELRSANSGSSASAMGLLLEAADEQIRRDHGGGLGRDELEKLLRAGAERTQLFGAPIELAPYIAAAARQTTSVAITAVRQSLRSERRQVDVVLMTGGGADVYADAIREAFPKARIVVPDAAVLANVRGFWRYADAAQATREDEWAAAPPPPAVAAEPAAPDPAPAELPQPAETGPEPGPEPEPEPAPSASAGTRRAMPPAVRPKSPAKSARGEPARTTK